MTPDEVAEALAWTGGTDLIDRLDAALAARAEAALAAQADAHTRASFAALGEASRRRILRAPEVTRRLLFASADRGESAAFISRAIAIEAALADAGPPPPEPRWSALGDVLLLPDGTRSAWPQLTGCAMALDFGSPWAQSVDLRGVLERTTVPRPQFTADQVATVAGRLAAACGMLGELSTTVRGFVDLATCVLVLQIDAAAPAHIASGTNGNFIGRSFVTNAHLATATPDGLAEAIVHEAIHGLLYRDSLARPWVSGDAALEAPRVRSPWTGRALSVRAFLEATCVWFGLSHLWALAHRQGLFDRGAARERLIRSISGFAQGPLGERVRRWRADIRPDLLDIVDALQQRLVNALDPA
jgi:hypothetical protein